MVTAKKKIKDKAPLVAPAKLNIWLFMLASSMLFAALLSAFIVHQPDAKAKETWTMFHLPTYFLISLIISMLSSSASVSIEIIFPLDRF